ncbi:MAG: NAD(P)/FAD-dependent oxidoreductase [Lentisphaeraceae bacterium]|nr:NAD(P)/FAD-dependent oxidoreductase [Lentisphaeraceae bacterium]
MKYDVIIIGAGMSGLAAGIRLSYYGKKVCILEKHAISGGLNSHYSKDGRRFDVGLHAMTNFVQKGVKSAPLSKLLRQLKIRYDELDLVEQSHSLIEFPGVTLKFGNEFTLLAEDVAKEFPSDVDGFLSLVEHVKNYNDVSLDAEYISAREVVASFVKSSVLQDMIFCPVMYYGSAVEDDMDFSQFCIMFKSLFLEGFCRPQIGVRHLLRILQRKFKDNGGELKMRSGVKKLHTSNAQVSTVELESGEILEGEKILSSAGICETYGLLGEEEKSPSKPGRLSFVETLLILDKMPKDFGREETITFFCREDKFNYRCPQSKTHDPLSGVICIPNNFQFTDKPLDEGIVRFTSLADYEVWKDLSPEEYTAAKDKFVADQIKHSGFGDMIKDHIVYTDSFTPMTVKRFTSHANGAIYGAPGKVKDGTTEYKNLFICGTDQGFLGIVGALLSGISMANLHLLR